MLDRTPGYYLAYDDEAGWEAFLSNPGRSSFGFTARHAITAARVQPGDPLSFGCKCCKLVRDPGPFQLCLIAQADKLT